MTPRAAISSSKNPQELLSSTPQTTADRSTDPGSGTHLAVSAQLSPRQEYISKMRRSEEETLQKCQSVLRKIRQAMAKQKNISMDVKNGISELEELLDITGDYRRNWKSAENARQASARMIIENSEILADGGSITTPKISKKKRSASSPAETRPGKKPKERAPERKQVTLPKEPPRQDDRDEAHIPKRRRNKAGRKRRPVIPRERSEAVIIRPAEGHSFADVLKNLRENIKPEETEVAVRSIRKTKTGAILLELDKGGKKNDFCDAIKGTLKDAADVRDVRPKVTVEIRDLDLFSTKEEVHSAIEEATDLQGEDIIVHLTEADNREQRRAFVSIPAASANTLMRTQRVKIGWTRCRVRYREEVKRCYRCFAAGHMQWDCDGPDRKGTGVCIRCGEKGHKLKECKNQPKCCLCSLDGKTKVDHLPGTRSCPSSKQKAR